MLHELLLMRTLKGKCKKKKKVGFIPYIFIFVKRGLGYPNDPVKKPLPTSKVEI